MEQYFYKRLTPKIGGGGGSGLGKFGACRGGASTPNAAAAGALALASKEGGS